MAGMLEGASPYLMQMGLGLLKGNNWQQGLAGGVEGSMAEMDRRRKQAALMKILGGGEQQQPQQPAPAPVQPPQLAMPEVGADMSAQAGMPSPAPAQGGGTPYGDYQMPQGLLAAAGAAPQGQGLMSPMTPGINPNAPGQRGGNFTGGGGLFNSQQRDMMRQMVAAGLLEGPDMAKVMLSQAFQKPQERRIIQDGDGRQRYADTGEYVFQGVKGKQPSLEERKWEALSPDQRQRALEIEAGLRPRATAAPRQGASPLSRLLEEQSRFAPDSQNWKLYQKRIDKLVGGEGDGSPFKTAETLRKEFDKGSDEFIKVRDAFGRVTVSGKDPSAAGDLALIFNYMKMLDPGSTVREGEFANAQNAGGVGDRVVSVYNSVLSGQRLNETQRADFLGRAKMLFDEADRGFQDHKSRYDGLAASFGVPSNLVTYDPYTAAAPAEAAPQPDPNIAPGMTPVPPGFFGQQLHGAPPMSPAPGLPPKAPPGSGPGIIYGR